MTNKRKLANQIKFLNMGNEDFIKDLQTHAKVFFPRVSQDLHKASSGQMMIENAAFIGDVLAFYLEQRFKNSNLFTADDIDQIYNLSQFLGYKPSGPPPARDFTNFYLEVPSTSSTTGFGPDMRYAVNFKNVQLTNNNGVVFEALEDVDFSGINPSSSLEARVSKRASDGSPSHFVLKVSEEVIGARTITETVNVGNYKAFREIEISEPNVIDIVSVEDSDGDKFYEVNYLAQEAIFEGIKNGGSDEEDVPYILKLKTVPKRFVKRTNPSTGKTSLVFGAGKAVDVGTAFIPDPADLAIDLKGRLTFAPEFIDPQNFLKTKTLGLAPYNTTLTIKARVGGGPRTNTSAESLRQIVSKEADFASAGLDIVEVNNTLKSFSTNNVKPIRGGDNAETVEEIKANAAAFFAAQGRLITREDYIARSLSLPPKFGKVFRVSANNNCDTNGGIQLWVIAKDSNGNLVPPSDSLRKNLKNYLSKFTRKGQGIDILDGRVINLAIDYTIVVAPGLNKTQVKFDTLLRVKDLFDINNWQLNQSLIIDDIICEIKKVEGVVSVANINIVNRNNQFDGRTYSTEVFSPEASSRNGIIFAPQNSIFEIKFKDGVDIKVGAL